VKTIASNSFEIDRACVAADMVIGSVLVPGAKAPKLVSNELVSRMKPGSVLVDIAVDQGGCFADSHATTHADPTFTVHGSLFYCVANMPGAVPNTSTYALTNATLPYVRAIANHGWVAALRADPSLALGLNTHGGELVSEPVATAHGLGFARWRASWPSGRPRSRIPPAGERPGLAAAHGLGFRPLARVLA
jgi:alanine dehydrogenase